MSYTVPQIDSIESQLNTLINTQQDNISTELGDGVDLLFSPSVLSRLIAGNNITIDRTFNPGQFDDGQIKCDVDLSNEYDKPYVDSTLAQPAALAVIIANTVDQIN